METRLLPSRAPNFHARVSDFVFLPERLALSPVVPAYRYGDQTFGLIVDWTISALIEAEALGITQDNVAEAAKREDMRAEQLLGHDFATAQALGLPHDWAAKVIAATGNYGEIFRAHDGQAVPAGSGAERAVDARRPDGSDADEVIHPGRNGSADARITTWEAATSRHPHRGRRAIRVG